MPYDIGESHPHVLAIRYRNHRRRYIELMSGVKDQALAGRIGSAMLMRKQAGDVLEEAARIRTEMLSRGFELPTRV